MHDLWVAHDTRASMDSAEITLEAVPSAGDVPAAEWDACANPVPDPNSLQSLDTLSASSCTDSRPYYNPFVSHAFFSAVEASGSAIARTGWGPRHLIAKIDDRIAGIVPCYLKSHSQGEYVFDRGWADAFERAGGRYYPKLQCSVPFTPATGPRLLVAPGQDTAAVELTLAAGLQEVTRQLGVSSAHVTFIAEAESKFLVEHGFLQRTDQQFHWHNQDFATFDDFLASL